MKVKNTVSQNIAMFPKIIQKKVCKTEKLQFYVCQYIDLCTQYLVGAPLAQMTASVRCGMGVISLWHCRGTIEPSACLYCRINCFSSFYKKYPIDSITGL